MLPVNQWWLLQVFIRRELKERYIGSASAIVWVFLHPLILLGVYTFIFKVVFQVRFPDIYRADFVVVVAIALWPWLMFQEGLQRGAKAINSNQALVLKSSFDRSLLVYASVSATFIIHLIGYSLVLSIFLLRQQLSFSLFGFTLVLLFLALLFIVTLGFALFFAVLHVYLKDTEFILGSVLMMMFYLTPILYPLKLVPDSLQVWIQLNPLTTLIEGMRTALLQHTIIVSPLMIAMIIGLFGFTGFSYWLFKRLSNHFEDYL